MKKSILTIMIMLLLAGAAHAAQLNYQIRASVDDSTASSTGSTYGQSILYVPYANTSRLAFWRWPVFIPKGATITSAYLWLRSTGSAGDSNGSTMSLELVARDNCPAFSSQSTYSLPVSGTAASWTIPGDWRANGGPNSDGWYRSPDIKGLISAFAASGTYKYGNYLGIRGSGVSGSWKTAYQFDGNQNSGAWLEINYTGGEAILDLFMAEPHVRIAQKIYCQIANVDSTDRLEALIDGKLIYQKNGNLGTEEIFTANYRNLKAGDHNLTVRIVGAGGQVRQSVTKTWRTLHNGVPAWGINENNALCKNGVPFFPITSWMLDKSKFTWPIASKINTLLVEGYYPEHNADSWLDYLDTASKYGWYAIGSGRISQTDENILSIVSSSKNHPALMGWFWKDEPNMGPSTAYTTAPTMKHWTDLCHQYDTTHPVFSNYYGYDYTHEESAVHNNRIKEYSYLYNADQFNGEKTAVVDVVGIDYYMYEYANAQSFVSLEDYALALDRAREWNYNLFPVMAFIETQDLHDYDAVGHQTSCGWKKTYAWTPDPTPAQLKNLIWVSIVHGAKGLSYFHYFCPIPQGNLDVLTEAKRQITELTPAILGADSSLNVTKEEIDGGRVDIMAKQYFGRLYIFAANLNDKSERVRFSVPGLNSGASVTVYGENRSVMAGSSYFDDNFSSLGVHIYIINMAGSGLSTPTGLRILGP